MDYDAAQATIGTEQGKPVPKAEILAAIKSINPDKYSGTFVDEPPDRRPAGRDR